MSRMALAEDVFMARADGMLIFLDLRADRYCALPSRIATELEPVLAANGEGAGPETAERLHRERLLGEGPTCREFAVTTAIPPTRELAAGTCSSVSAALAGIARLRSEHLLKGSHIAEVVRHRRTQRLHSAAREDAGEEQIYRRAQLFAASRALRGGRNACLKEALALLLYLGRNGASADWVFAVKGAPFAAHCWVQHGDVVLNDSVENVRAYTPIMVA